MGELSIHILTEKLFNLLQIQPGRDVKDTFNIA